MNNPQDSLKDALRLHQSGRIREAINCYSRILSSDRNNPQVLFLLGTANVQIGQLKEGIEQLERSIVLNPNNAFAHNNCGAALKDLKRTDEALACYEKALALKPDYPEAYLNRGAALQALKRPDEALVAYDKAISLKPDYAEAYYNRGNALQELMRPEQALASYDKAIALRPDYAEAHNNRGNVLGALMRPDEALASYEQASVLKPDYADAFFNRGNALRELKRADEALASYDKAIALRPDYAEAHNNRGNALGELKRPEEALVAYDKAISLKSDFAEAHSNRGNALGELKRTDEALVAYDKAISLNPDHEFLLGTYLHTRMKLCEWSLFEENLDKLKADLSVSKPVTAPFPLLAVLDSAALQKTAAKVYSETMFPERHALGCFDKREPDGKIRIGYFSADFHNHATAYLMAELFEAHNPGRFELYGFSFGPNKNDEMRRRVSSAFDRFIDVRDKSDRQVAQLSRDLGIDIAIDLKGHTHDARTGIFAEGCAPVQVNYLGYPGTMGAKYIDYVIADKTVIPADSQSDFTEKVVYLPHSYQVNDSRRRISDRVFTKKELGLPESGFVFCCFNNNYKILPSLFDSWIRILKAVDGSVLWLFEDNPTAARNLRNEAMARGLDDSRLTFARRMPLGEHLARHQFADLFIDTLPCNAHTTASDALWAGLPVLTCMGKSFASRVAASLLKAIELPELIAHTQEQYETKAIELAKDPAKLNVIKGKLKRNRTTTPLFNSNLFAGHIEAAYEEMYARYQAGLPPTVLEVQA